MTLSSRLKRIILSPACFGPSPTLDDPQPSTARRKAPAGPPELQSRAPQPGAPGAPAPRARRHWYSLKRSSPPGPQPAPPQPTSPPPTHPAPARLQPRISTWAAQDHLAGFHTKEPQHEPRRTTREELLAARESTSAIVRQARRDGPWLDGSGSLSRRTALPHPVPAVDPSTRKAQDKVQPMGQDRRDAQASFDFGTRDPLEGRQHGPVSPRLWRSVTLEPWANPPPAETVQPEAPPDVSPPRTRKRRWPKLNFLHRRTRPPETVEGSRPIRAEAPPLTPIPSPDPPAPDSSVAARQAAGPVFDESRPSSQRIDPSQVEPQDETASLGGGLPLQFFLSPPRDSVVRRDSFDGRTSVWQDFTQHGPVNRRFWNSLTPHPWADMRSSDAPQAPSEGTPAAAPETRRSLGAEVLRLGGVLGSHTARQVVATGTSTLVREGVNIGLAMGLRRQPGLAAGLTLSMTLLNLMAQLQREKRVLRAPDEAARGFHSLSQAQWQAASPEQRAALRQEQQASSRRVTRLHLVSNLITTSMAMVGAARPGGRIGAMAVPVPSALLGQMARQWVYVGLRDGLQATFTSVQPRQPSPLPNIEQRRMRTAAATYGGVQSLLGYAQEAVMPRVLKALSQGSSTIRASGGLLSSVGSGLGQWARTIAAVAGVRAGLNVVGETIDDVQLTHHDAAEAGGEQVPKLDVRALDPARRDYGRLLDHAMVRVFANDVVGGVMNAVGLATGQLPARFADVASFVGNFGVGLIIHMTYPLVGNNFAAAGLVRDAMRPPRPVDPEAAKSPRFGGSQAGSQVSTTTSYYRPEA